MGKIITSKDQPGGVFAQIELDDGARVLISLSTSAMNIKILKLLWGSIPIRTIYEATLEEATDIFLTPENWGKQGVLLDKVVDTVLGSKSIVDIKIKINELKNRRHNGGA